VIVDAHAHWGPWFFTGLDTPNLTVMDRYGIDVASCPRPRRSPTTPASGNRALARFLETAPDRLLGYVTVHPRRLDQAERDVRALLATKRFVGAKIHTDYTGCPLNSPQLRDALAMLADLDCPALVHTWDTSPPPAPPRTRPSASPGATPPGHSPPGHWPGDARANVTTPGIVPQDCRPYSCLNTAHV
jgi:predicted TIM-barrel fold metal-dependent hydrolase